MAGENSSGVGETLVDCATSPRDGERLDFRVLGPIEVRRGTRGVDVRGKTVRAVLATFVMNANRVVSTDQLLDNLWGEAPPPTATTALHGYISMLRRAFEPGRARRAASSVLVSQPPGYVLRVEPDSVDAIRFASLAQQGRALLAGRRFDYARETLADAMALWRGSPYVELTFHPFVDREISRLGEIRADAAEDHAEAMLALGLQGEAVGDLEPMVAEYPLRERRWQLLALGLYRSDRQGEAVRALARARQTLIEQLGIEPSAALRQLEIDVLCQSPELDWRPAHVTGTGHEYGHRALPNDRRQFDFRRRSARGTASERAYHCHLRRQGGAP